MLLTPRNCFWGFCETDSLGALRFRPPWWPWEETPGAVTGVGCCWWALKW